MPFGLPKSLLWFVATGVIFLFQVIPFTGIFLMFAMAPFWSVILINVGMAALALEAVWRQGYILWLAVPVVYVAGYLGAATMSHEAFQRIDAEFRAHNASAIAAAPAFNRRSSDVVVLKKTYRAGGIAQTLATRYGLGVAYESSINRRTTNHLAFWLGKPPLCQTIQKNPSARRARIYAYSLRTGDRRRRSKLCRISGPADPPSHAVFIELEETRQKDWLLPATFHTLTLRYATGAVVTLKSGYAAPLSWLPKPVMGCWLNSGAPSWDCGASFLRWRQKGLGTEVAYGGGNAALIANALRLAELTEAEMVARARTSLPPALAAALRTETN